VDRTTDGGAIIIVGTNNLIGKWKADLDARRVNATSAPPESGPPSTRRST
jgi:hypothetical protein